MRAMTLITVTLFGITGSLLFAQSDRLFNGQNNDKNTITSFDQLIQQENKMDYKIISSNSSYIEIEFYPASMTAQKFNINSESFEVYDFENSSSTDIRTAGSPDIKYRTFSVALPSDFNNLVQVIDFDVKELSNINIAPVPFVNFINPGVRGFENIVYSYIKGSRYTENKFFPENISVLSGIGNLRELTIGNLNIYPLQYNPVSGVLKVYSRIRVRVSFGSSPLPFNRPRSREEISLLKGSALNSDLALNWLSPKFKNDIRQNLLAPSVLAAGDWYRIQIDDNGSGGSEGIYKITKSVLQSAGINLNGIDPRTIKLYGNGGYLLSEKLEDPRPEDLQQIRVYFAGEEDGSFDAQDYILFYGRSVNNWKYDTTTGLYSHYLNVYSKTNYYWICFHTSGNGLRMEPEPSSINNPALIPTSFTEKIFNECEDENLLNEGNLWLCHRKDPGSTFEWNTTLTGLEAGSDILYKIKPAARCLEPASSYFLIKDDYSTMSEVNLPMQSVQIGFGNWIYTETYTFTLNQSQKTNGEQVKFRARYEATSQSAEGYMDWWEIQYKRRLSSAAGDYIRFDAPAILARPQSTTVEYNVSSFSNNDIKVFDITDHNNVKLIQPVNISSSSVKFRKDETGGEPSKFIVTGPNGYKTFGASSISARIPNQNLRGITDGASFVIITHSSLLPAAERLKTKRESVGINDPNYLKTLIVTVDQIYNEFSGGILDASAIRDFLKHAYLTWTEKPAHVLLLGDGDFDYKNQLNILNKVELVPAFEITDPQLNQVAGYTTDDFYVNAVGNNIPSPYNDPPDMAVGRIPANSLQEANDYLDKVDCYESGLYNGPWKSRMVFVADDQVTASGCETVLHLAQIEDLAENHTPSTIDRRKIYLVTYPTVITPQGRRKPQVNADIVKNWNEGALDIHYTGHGSPDLWAHEYVLEKDVVLSQLFNECHYPFVSIASCDMSKFDNPISQSAGELFMMKPKKGAIGTLAATRPVYAEGNAALMREFFDNLYIPRDTLLLPKRFGVALNRTKQTKHDMNDLKYVLMCDPSVRVQLPRFRSRVDSISGLSGDTMRALSRVKIYGSIIHPDSSFWNDYNGNNILKVYDVERQITLTDECNYTHYFKLNGGIIYSGTQRISNGHWVAEYIVPKDISYRNSRGKMVNYFYNTSADGAGIYINFYVGGIDPNAPVDSIGPRISLYLNTRNFRTGDVVNKNFNLIADLYDESGINTTGTIGHKIESIIDNNENNKVDLTNFYNSDTSYTSGSLEYGFADITEGKHVLRLKAWDTYNNSSEAEIEFNVSDAANLSVMNVYNYPNPFKDNTTFTFQHNYPNPINVKIKIYTVAGRLIREISQPNVTDKFVAIAWTGKDEDGETLGNGVYIYKLIVETGEGQAITNIGKLAVLK
ncbi:MAG TPA: type IX secretion system sortase PorU [Ignavibacteria bacterium]